MSTRTVIEIKAFRERECLRAAKYRRDNAEKVRTSANAYNKANAERRKAWRRANKDKVAAADAKWYRANADRIKASSVARYAENHKAHISSVMRWRAKNPGYHAAVQRNRRARLKGARGRHTSGDISRLFALQKGCCPACRSRLRMFHADHVTPLARGGGNGPTDIQLLCQRCNQSKGAKDPIEFMQERGFLI